MKNALIIAASDNVYWDFRGETPLVICADGGVRNAARLGIKPDLTVGDGDSAELGEYAGGRVILPAEKDLSDTEACVFEALKAGCKRIYMTGCTGGRLDHFLANLFLLQKIKSSGAEGVLLDATNEITIAEGDFFLPQPHNYRYFSLIPVNGGEIELSIAGARYELNRRAVSRESSLTISNEPLPGRDIFIRAGGEVFVVKSERRCE